MDQEDLDLNFDNWDGEKATAKLIEAAAKGAHGYVYYESKVEYKNKGDSQPVPVRVTLYEKYHKPDPKCAAILKQQGIELVVRSRS